MLLFSDKFYGENADLIMEKYKITSEIVMMMIREKRG